MTSSPTQAIQRCLWSRLAISVAATPISTTEIARPTTRTQVWSLAAPATARTLSRLIEMSATRICMMACGIVFRGAAVSASPASLPAPWPLPRNSRNIFQQTHSSRTPPARVMPTIASSCAVMAAKPIRMMVAAMMPQKIALRRWSGGRPAAAMPTTMALSPARTMSMNSTWASGTSQSGMSEVPPPGWRA